MQKSPSDNLNHSSDSTHHTLQRSSTLNRHYVARPGSYYDETSNVRTIAIETPEAEAAPAISHYVRKISIMDGDTAEPAQVIEPVQADEPIVETVTEQPTSEQQPDTVEEIQAHIPTANELKNLATEQALESAAEQSIESQKKSRKDLKAEKQAEKQARKDALKASKEQAKQAKKTRRQLKSPHRGRRFALAFSCAAACIAVIGYFIYTNAPDLSVRVAAMQTGIDAKYPSYTPRDYQMSSVSTNPEGRIIIEFSGPDGNSYTLTEEKSTWDSAALLNNYVKPTWQENYDTVREQGITIYISGSDAAWVNGGMSYTIDASAGNLTKKQIKTIVTSL